MLKNKTVTKSSKRMNLPFTAFRIYRCILYYDLIVNFKIILQELFFYLRI